MARAALHPPDGRQGPGPMPAALVDALGLAIARRAAGVLPGERKAPGVGAGTELFQLRPYEPGDDVRQLDPAASARTGIPHVRLQVPERALTTWLVLDVSPSMAFGTADRLKADVAEGVVLVLGRLATRRGGRVGPPATAAGAQTGERLEVDPHSPRLRERFAQAEAEERTAVAGDLRHALAEHIVLTTEGDWLRSLGGRLR